MVRWVGGVNGISFYGYQLALMNYTVLFVVLSLSIEQFTLHQIRTIRSFVSQNLIITSIKVYSVFVLIV